MPQLSLRKLKMSDKKYFAKWWNDKDLRRLTSLEEFHSTIELATTLYRNGLPVVMSFLRPQVGTKIYNEYKDELFEDFRGIIRPFEIDDQIKKIVKGNSILYSWYHTYKTPGIEEKIKTYRETNIKYIPIQQRLMTMGVQ